MDTAIAGVAFSRQTLIRASRLKLTPVVDLRIAGNHRQRRLKPPSRDYGSAFDFVVIFETSGRKPQGD